MNNIWVALIGSIIQCVIYGFTISAVLQPKYKFSTLYVILILSAAVCATLFGNVSVYANPVVMASFLGFCFFFFYKDKWTTKALAYFFCMIALTLSDVLLTGVLVFVMGSDLQSIKENVDFARIYSIPTVAIMLLLYVFIWNKSFKKQTESAIYFVLFPLSQTYFIYALIQLSFLYVTDNIFNLLYLGILICIVADVGLYVAMRNMNKKLTLEKQVEVYEMQLQAQLAHYQELSLSQQELRNIKHDINNHLQTIDAMIGRGHIAESQNVINEVKAQLDEIEFRSFTKNNVIDALLLVKLRAAEACGCSLKITAQQFSSLKVKDIHLCTVLSNLLDNAIEACSAADNNPEIDLSIALNKDFLVIKVSNPISSPVAFSKNGKPESTKKDYAIHGIGLSNVEKIAEDYKGNVRYDISDDVFCVTVIL